MNESQQSMRVEPLQYEQATDARTWADLFKAMGLAAMLYGIAQTSMGVAQLWLYGFLGNSPVTSAGGRLFELVIYVIPNVGMGMAWMAAGLGVLSNSGRSITAMRMILICILITIVGIAGIRALGVLGSMVTGSMSAPSMGRYQAVASLVSAVQQSALPLLCLGMIRINRRKAQPGF